MVCRTKQMPRFVTESDWSRVPEAGWLDLLRMNESVKEQQDFGFASELGSPENAWFALHTLKNVTPIWVPA